MLEIGTLVRDDDDSEIGIIVGPLVVREPRRQTFRAHKPIRTQLVWWPSNNEPYEMDLKAIETGWVKVVDEDG